ncbi:unnamed protein product [Pocillopora meandrina]|uniref:Uncharacterized protein n=1 Tax=Pocillopora meandrina TaxID=46732 RepID=A0AAU9X8I7_9CNID|nr:unnamed protein product [Pocillopora meandrina]
MKLWLIAAITLSFGVQVVLSLKCLSCASKKSWDDCKGKSISCKAPATDACFKIYLKSGSTESFERGCSTYAGCDTETKPLCKDANECDIYCCNSNDCNAGNAGTATHTSGVLLLSCALASLFKA